MRRIPAIPASTPDFAREPGDEHAMWLKRRQEDERHMSLIRRLEHLAADARNERFDDAARLLREAAEELRFALARDKASGSSLERLRESSPQKPLTPEVARFLGIAFRFR